jgi:hypothetical protein
MEFMIQRIEIRGGKDFSTSQAKKRVDPPKNSTREYASEFFW